MSCDIF